jgi:hypothetical protein
MKQSSHCQIRMNPKKPYRSWYQDLAEPWHRQEFDTKVPDLPESRDRLNLRHYLDLRKSRYQSNPFIIPGIPT